MTTVEDPNIQAKKKKIWVILLGALAVFILCSASVLIYFERFSPNARASLTAQAEEKTDANALAYSMTMTESTLPTLTLTSTHTEVPTHTQLPTTSPEPTQDLQDTQQPIDQEANEDDTSATPTETLDQSSLPALTCRDLELQHENLTELLWKRYVDEIIGRKITFSGKINEVYQDQKVEIKDENCQNLFTALNLFGIPEEDLVNLQKDQTLRGEGTIRDVNFVYGNNIDINVDYYQK